MTYEEEQKAIIRAKHWMHDVIDYHQDVLDGEEPGKMEKTIFEECEVILNALENQIPKKPATEHGQYICPECRTKLITYKLITCNWSGGIHYCHYCGIAIDWENEV